MPSFRLKRGNATKVGSYVGSEGELIYNTETKKVHVMDGSTSGGTVVEGTSPTALSELTNDVGFATTAEIPTALSALTNDVGFATTAQLPSVPTALSELTNDVGFAVGTIPTSLSELTNDAGLITAAEVPASNPNIISYDTTDTFAPGDPVVLNADGSVSKVTVSVTGTISPLMYNDAGRGFIANTGESTLTSNAYDTHNERVIVAWQTNGSHPNGSTNVISTKVGEINSNSISYGIEQVVVDNVYKALELLYDEFNQRVCLILNKYDDAGNHLWITPGTVDPSSNTITWGTTTTAAVNLYKIKSAYNPNDGTIIISGMSLGDGYYTIQCRYNSSTDQYDAGVPKLIHAENITAYDAGDCAVAYSESHDQYVFVCIDNGDVYGKGFAASSLQTFAFEVSPSNLNTWSFKAGLTTPSEGIAAVTSYAVTGGDFTPKCLTLIPCPASETRGGTVVCLYRPTGTTSIRARALHISNSSMPEEQMNIEMGAEVTVTDDSTTCGGICIPSNDLILTTNQRDDYSSRPLKITWVNLGSVTSLSVGTTESNLFAPNCHYYQSFSLVPDINQVLISIPQDKFGIVSKEVSTYLYQAAANLIASNQANLFGIAGSATADNSVEVVVSGAVEVDISDPVSSSYDLGVDPPSLRGDVFVNTLGKMTKSNTGFTIGKLIKKDLAANKFTIKL
jgi:hypothetical protein